MEYPFDSFEALQPFIGHPDIKKGKNPLRKCHVCDVTLAKSNKILDCHVKNYVREHYNQCVETRNIFVECSELRIDILENHERFKEGPVCSFCGKQNLKKPGYHHIHYKFCAEAQKILKFHEKNAQIPESQQSLTNTFSGNCIKSAQNF